MMNEVTAPSRGGLSSRVAAALMWVLDSVLAHLERRRQRQQLLELSDEMLHDIGISRADALMEAHRLSPFR